MFSVVRACLHGWGGGNAVPYVTSIHDTIGQSQVTCPVDPEQLSSRTSFRGFGHRQKLSRLCSPPKYYCFHPGTLCKNVYLKKIPG